MKTKYSIWFIIFGLFLGLSVASYFSQPSKKLNDGPSIVVFLIYVILAVLFLGYGLKLRKLKKKGIKDTNDKK